MNTLSDKEQRKAKRKESNRKVRKVCWLVLLLIIVVSGIKAILPVGIPKGITNTLEQVSQVSVPDEVQIVGLGEATHGNKEFVQVRGTVLERLASTQGFNVVVLEGDFGGCSLVNDFVVDGIGSAREVVEQIGFRIYKSEEMVDFIQGIYEYNKDKEDDDKIHFAGCDLQRYDNNKKYLFQYLDQVDERVSEEYQEKLEILNDETVYTESDANVQAGLKEVENLMQVMESNKEMYLQLASEMEFDKALQHAITIKENAILQGTNVPYANTRDAAMAQKVEWIYEYENKIRPSKILLLGHNGHIEKSSASMYTSLGSHLQEKYGEHYFAIGTEFYKNTFIVTDNTGAFQPCTIKNGKTSKLAYALSKVVDKEAFIDFDKAMQEPSVAKLLTTKTRMGNADTFQNAFMAKLPLGRTLKQVPNDAYDGIIFIKEVSATKMLEVE